MSEALTVDVSAASIVQLEEATYKIISRIFSYSNRAIDLPPHLRRTYNCLPHILSQLERVRQLPAANDAKLKVFVLGFQEALHDLKAQSKLVLAHTSSPLVRRLGKGFSSLRMDDQIQKAQRM